MLGTHACTEGHYIVVDICVDKCVVNPCLRGETCTCIVICVRECDENVCLYGGTCTKLV